MRDGGWIYPCERSRKDIANATVAPHPEDEMAEPLFPIEWRGSVASAKNFQHPQGLNWRFRVPNGETIRFIDAHAGAQAFTAMQDFGDFL
ncbi:hypothetical protein RZS08_33115, partial [Arthrospira platensis SPKY1]|nr:hypothetical protein [Arthrospira platensis SPKY1]